jgi:hypothetical protein
MFAGVTFIDASNSLIYAHAIFVCRDSSSGETRHQIHLGPHGIYIDEDDGDGGWKERGQSRDREDVVALLPRDQGWTWATFLFSLSFWGEGYEAGRNRETRRRRTEEAARKALEPVKPCPADIETDEPVIYDRPFEPVDCYECGCHLGQTNAIVTDDEGLFVCDRCAEDLSNAADLAGFTSRSNGEDEPDHKTTEVPDGT